MAEVEEVRALSFPPDETPRIELPYVPLFASLSVCSHL